MSDNVRLRYLAEKESLLKDFGIEVTDSMISHIDSLYPNDIAVENYTHKIILDYFKNRSKSSLGYHSFTFLINVSKKGNDIL